MACVILSSISAFSSASVVGIGGGGGGLTVRERKALLGGMILPKEK